MNYAIPSWIQPADEVGNFARGISQGASIGEAQARQMQQAAEMAQQRQMQQEKLAADALQRQTEMETQKEYRKAQQSLEQQRIQDAQDRAAESARHNTTMEGFRGQEVGAKGDLAATKYLAQQKFAKAYQDHIEAGDKDPMLSALLDVPEMITPTTLSTGARGGQASRNMAPSTAYAIYKDLSAKGDARTPEESQAMEAARGIVHGALNVAPKAPPKLDTTIGSPPSNDLTPPMPPGQQYDLMPVGPSMASPAAAAPAKRLKVKGPGGKTGTVPEGTELPDGWELVE